MFKSLRGPRLQWWPPQPAFSIWAQAEKVSSWSNLLMVPEALPGWLLGPQPVHCCRLGTQRVHCDAWQAEGARSCPPCPIRSPGVLIPRCSPLHPGDRSSSSLSAKAPCGRGWEDNPRRQLPSLAQGTGSRPYWSLLFRAVNSDKTPSPCRAPPDPPPTLLPNLGASVASEAGCRSSLVGGGCAKQGDLLRRRIWV